jgi:hypothetical protein
MVRSAFSTMRVLGLLATITASSALIPAAAYDIGGHHYIISTILATVPPPSPNAADAAATVDPYKRLESFCVELPDLVPELDAVTQRIHVVRSKSDWQWGIFGRCATPTSRHMVATQWYIHGLTGLNSEQVRTIAHAIITDRQNAAAAATNAQDRVNLICEAGFGLHLLGDTFAHSQLSDPDTLYKTGNGHWKDKHVPDDILSRSLQRLSPKTRHWDNWVAEAATALGRPNNSPQLTLLVQPILLAQTAKQGIDYGETSLRDTLHSSLPKDWEPYQPNLESWRQDSPITGEIHSDVSCDGLIRKGLTGVGIDPVDDELPNCDAVWTEYLKVAMRFFTAASADPVRNGKLEDCDATGDRISDGVDPQ